MHFFHHTQADFFHFFKRMVNSRFVIVVKSLDKSRSRSARWTDQEHVPALIRTMLGLRLSQLVFNGLDGHG